MPITYSEVSTPKGHRIARSVSSGAVGKEDIDQFMTLLNGPLKGMRILSVVEGDTKYSPEARIAVRNLKIDEGSVLTSAMVIKSPAQRIVLQFMLKMSFLAQDEKVGMKVFSEENDAIEWIDTFEPMK